MSNYAFSFIMGTLGRTEEIYQFINSLINQSKHFSWELIIVDQNEDERVFNVLERVSFNIPSDCSLIHIKTPVKGLSHARNIGLTKVSRKSILAFPDDDCIYSKNVLSDVYKMIKDINSDKIVLSLTDTDEISQLKCSSCNNEKLYSICSYNIFRDAISYTIFIFGNSGNVNFDEKLGVGCYFGAAEETDYIYRLKLSGWNLYRSDKKMIFHPNKENDFRDLSRAFSYNLGIGAFFKKHLKKLDLGLLSFFVLSMFKLGLRIFFVFILFDSKKFKWYTAIFKGRLLGFARFRNSLK